MLVLSNQFSEIGLNSEVIKVVDYKKVVVVVNINKCLVMLGLCIVNNSNKRVKCVRLFNLQFIFEIIFLFYFYYYYLGDEIQGGVLM